MLEMEQGLEQEMSGTATGGDERPLKARLEVRVQAITALAHGISGYELVAAQGGALPPFSAGAHVEVHIGDLIRSYSLSGDPADRTRYEIAVLKEDGGRGGSKAIHETVRVGDVLTISAPINHFPLAGKEARSHLLLAGGIGVTPMMAMIAELEARGAKWTMHYMTRDPERTAFRERLAPLVAAGKVYIHHDGGDPARSVDIAGLVAEFEIGTHLYFCGPPGFMSACARSVEAWPPHAVHREYFAAAEGSGEAKPNLPFQVKIASTGQMLEVPADRSIVDVLRDAGCVVETDCKDGYCGTCITRYLSGEPEHRDTVLSEKERKSYVMVCCARASKGPLELDL